jgi:acetyl esterase/lipase
MGRCKNTTPMEVTTIKTSQSNTPSQILESMGGEAFDIGMFGDIATLRDFLSVSKKNMTASHAPVAGVKEEKDHQITMRDGEKITVRTYTPEKAGGPLYVMYHGGGWCIGGLENEELLCRLICGKLGFVAVNVDYRLAPEHVFPVAHNDCWDATKWVRIICRRRRPNPLTQDRLLKTHQPSAPTQPKAS